MPAEKITGHLTDYCGAVVTVTRRGEKSTMLYVAAPDDEDEDRATEVDLYDMAQELAAVLRTHAARCHRKTLDFTEMEDAGGVRLAVGSGYGSVHIGYGEPPLVGEHHPLIELRAEGCAELIRLLEGEPPR